MRGAGLRDGFERADLGRGLEAVPALHLGGRRPLQQHLVEPRPQRPDQRLHRRGSGRADRLDDPAARRRDLLVAWRRPGASGSPRRDPPRTRCGCGRRRSRARRRRPRRPEGRRLERSPPRSAARGPGPQRRCAPRATRPRRPRRGRGRRVRRPCAGLGRPGSRGARCSGRRGPRRSSVRFLDSSAQGLDRGSLDVEHLVPGRSAADDLNRGRWNVEEAPQEAQEGGVGLPLDRGRCQPNDEGAVPLAGEAGSGRPRLDPHPERGAGGIGADV